MERKLSAAILVLITLVLSACVGNKKHTRSYVLPIVDWQPIGDSEVSDVIDRVAVAGRELPYRIRADVGIETWLDSDSITTVLPGSFEGLDARVLSDATTVLATVDGVAQRVIIAKVVSANLVQTLELPRFNHEVTGVCLHRDKLKNLYAFVLSESGQGSQWLLGHDLALRASPIKIRTMPLPPQAQFCYVDDSSASLYVNEEAVGLWHYSAHPEAEARRQPIAMAQPFGQLKGGAGDFALTPGGLWILDPEGGVVNQLSKTDSGFEPVGSIALPELADPEQLQVTEQGEHVQLLVRDDDTGLWWQGELPVQSSVSMIPGSGVMSTVSAALETDPVQSQGDAADDPAIWVHPTDAQRSLVLATDKKAGLQVYDLSGRQIQSLAIGRLNNVDVRSGLAGQHQHIAVASHRDNNSISLFTIDPVSLNVEHQGDIATPLAEVYGICLYRPTAQDLYAFINDKNGRVLQYKIDTIGMTGKRVREFSLASQPEGCVADDRRRQLFIGEEDVGIWALDAEPSVEPVLRSVAKVGADLHDDVEGIALYSRPNGLASWLVVSSQGNDSYVLLHSEPPYRVVGAFQVGINHLLGIDGASETDGLDVVSANLGGIWQDGMLVVQDGRNRMPEAAQNFKLVPWQRIDTALKLTQ